MSSYGIVVFYSRPFFRTAQFPLKTALLTLQSLYIRSFMRDYKNTNVWRLILSHFGGNLASSEIPRHLFELHLHFASQFDFETQLAVEGFWHFFTAITLHHFLQSGVDGCLWSPGVEASVVSSTEIFRAISYCQGRARSVAQLISTASAATLTTQPKNIGMATLVTLFLLSSPL